MSRWFYIQFQLSIEVKEENYEAAYERSQLLRKRLEQENRIFQVDLETIEDITDSKTGAKDG